MTIGNRIQAKLDENNMKQNQLAKKLEISPSTLNGYIKDYREPDIKMLGRIAKALGTSIEFLATGEIEKKAPSFDAEEALRHYIEEKLGRQPNLDELDIIKAAAEGIINRLKQ